MIVVLVGPRPGAPPAPETTPIGRAALHIRSEGISLAFSTDGRSFFQARPGGWDPVVPSRVMAVQDRFPSQTRPQAYRKALEALGHPPMGNPESLTLLCRDKIASQHWLTSRVPMPAIEYRPAHFPEALATWGSAFLKPRYGAMGRGIQRVLPGDELPLEVQGAVVGILEPTFLQREVPAPRTGAIAVRQLVQRLPGGDWIQLPGVARLAPPGEVVANVSQGATACPAREVLGPETLTGIQEQTALVAQAVAAHPDGTWAVEVGVDFAIDGTGQPHLLEVNSRPRWRSWHRRNPNAGEEPT